MATKAKRRPAKKKNDAAKAENKTLKERGNLAEKKSKAAKSKAGARKAPPRERQSKGVLYEIALTARLRASGEVVFEPDNQFYNEDTNTFRFSKDDFRDMATVDYHLIEFRLVNDETKRGLRFPNRAKDAMWVVNRPACPVATDENQYDVVKPLAVVNDHTLLAMNLNKTKGSFGFRLNFVGTGSTDYIPWDPIGENSDGGIH